MLKDQIRKPVELVWTKAVGVQSERWDEAIAESDIFTMSEIRQGVTQ